VYLTLYTLPTVLTVYYFTVITIGVSIIKHHEKLNYVAFAAKDLKVTKAFFEEVFAWAFADYGDRYCAFSGQSFDIVGNRL